MPTYNIVWYELFKILLTYISHKLNWTNLFRIENTTHQQLPSLMITRWRSAASSSISELLESKPRERLFVLILVFVLVLVLVKVLVVVHVLVHNIRNVLNILEIVLERYLEF